MADGYLLTAADRDLLQRLLDRERGRPRNPSLRGGGGYDDTTTPETYVARTPAEGIAGMTGGTGTGATDVPGSAECAVYRRVEAGGSVFLEAVPGIVRTVNNLSAADVPGGAAVLITRDKFGDWYVVAALEEGEPWRLDVATNACLDPDTGALTLEMVPLFFPASVTRGAAYCKAADSTCCTDQTGTGTGTGSGTGTATATATSSSTASSSAGLVCCPDRPTLPTTLTAVFHDPSGGGRATGSGSGSGTIDWGCLDGVEVTLTGTGERDPLTGAVGWSYTAPISGAGSITCGTGADGQPITVELFLSVGCTQGLDGNASWTASLHCPTNNTFQKSDCRTLDTATDPPKAPIVPSVVSCDPIALTFTTELCANCDHAPSLGAIEIDIME